LPLQVQPFATPNDSGMEAPISKPASTQPETPPGTPLEAAAPLPEFAVEVDGLTKVYPGTGKMPAKRALDGVDLAVRRGELFGLLGPNGAGKSTLINILAGLTIKSAGQVRVWGFNLDSQSKQARAAIGVVPQELNLDPFFSPREALDLEAGLFGVPRAARRTDEILRAIGLGEEAGAYARALSGGMRRRLMVGKALVHNPPILVLDEPTAGVDVELRRQLWDYVRGLNRSGATILLTTHYLEEAEQLCDRIAIIDQGRVVACDTTSALLARLDHKELAITVADDIEAVPPELAAFEVELHSARRLVFRYAPSRVRIAEILAAVQAAKLTIADLTTEESDLEDIFLQITRQRLSSSGD
jgi:ABC-2 type transport system ATP-binding protein